MIIIITKAITVLRKIIITELLTIATMTILTTIATHRRPTTKPPNSITGNTDEQNSPDPTVDSPSYPHSPPPSPAIDPLPEPPSLFARTGSSA